MVDANQIGGPHGTSMDSVAVDARQDELMALESPEGRPPTHRQRMLGWRWFAIMIPLLVVGAGVIALMRGARLVGLAQFGLVFALLLLIGGLPRWAASLSRGREEAAARKRAVAEVSAVEHAHPQTVACTMMPRE